jgi:hypothetical protein
MKHIRGIQIQLHKVSCPCGTNLSVENVNLKYDTMFDRCNLCIFLVNWQGFTNDAEIEAFAAQYGLTDNEERFVGALVFNGLKGLSYANYSKNDKISYKIRLIDKYFNTDQIMPWLSIDGFTGCKYEVKACVSLL